MSTLSCEVRRQVRQRDPAAQKRLNLSMIFCVVSLSRLRWHCMTVTLLAIGDFMFDHYRTLIHRHACDETDRPGHVGWCFQAASTHCRPVNQAACIAPQSDTNHNDPPFRSSSSTFQPSIILQSLRICRTGDWRGLHDGPAPRGAQKWNTSPDNCSKHAGGRKRRKRTR